MIERMLDGRRSTPRNDGSRVTRRPFRPPGERLIARSAG